MPPDTTQMADHTPAAGRPRPGAAGTPPEQWRASYLDLYDSAPMGYITIDADGLVRAANLTAAALLGRDRDELIGGELANLIAPHDRGIYRRPCRPTDTAGTPQWCELQLLRHDGTTLRAHLAVTQAPPGDGATMTHVALADISWRQQAGDAVRDSEPRFQALVDAIPHVVWTTTPAGELDYASQRTLDLAGCSLDELRGWGWSKLLHPDDVPECMRCWEHSLKTGEHFEIEYRLRAANDMQYHWYLTRAVPLRDRNGAITRWLGTNTDISDRKHAEAALQASERELRLITNRMPGTI